MLKMIAGAVVFNLPFALPLGMLCFLFMRWCLQRRNKVVDAVVKIVFLLCMLALVGGMVYGTLRFGGVICFPDDNTGSQNWFDTSWRDDGFAYVYWCGVAALGFVVAFLRHAPHTIEE